MDDDDVKVAIRAAVADENAAESLIDVYTHAMKECNPRDRWATMLTVLSPRLPFDLHNLFYHKCYDGTAAPWPSYFPSQQAILSSNVYALCLTMGIDPGQDCFEALYAASIADRERFWAVIINHLKIKFETRTDTILDASRGIDHIRYMPGTIMNIVDSVFDARRPREVIAIKFQREEESLVYEWTLGDLEKVTNRVATGLKVIGLLPGDKVAIFMQMTAESVAIYLGIIKAGLVAVSIAESFSTSEVRARLEISNCKAVFTQDFIYRGGKRLPLFARILETGWTAAKAIIIPGQFTGPEPAGATIDCALREGDITWAALLSRGVDTAMSVKVEAEMPINILFSSGTTGTPKAIPWNHTTPIKAAMDGLLHQDIKAGECLIWPTSMGWMMGPWLVFASLLNHASMALFYGSPTSRPFCEFIATAKVDLVGIIPSITKQIRHSRFLDTIDWSHVRRFSSTAEASNPADQLWLMSRRPGYAPVIEYCGGTEIGGGYLSGSVTQAQAPSWFSTMSPSLDFQLLGDIANEGEIALIGPSLGLSNVVLNSDHFKVYFEGMPKGAHGVPFRRHGDRIAHVGTFFRAMGRADDTMKLGGIKISSVQLESICCHNEVVGECAAIGMTPVDGGPDLLVVFVVVDQTKPASKIVTASSLKDEIQLLIKTHLNPLFKLHDVVIIESLPRTATGKVMRRELRARYVINPKL